MNRSSKYGFYLPQNTDPISVSDFNYNFGLIDDNLITETQSFTSTQKSTARANLDLNLANNLTTTESGYVLDARQGKVLSDNILSDRIKRSLEEGTTNSNGYLTTTIPATKKVINAGGIAYPCVPIVYNDYWLLFFFHPNNGVLVPDANASRSAYVIYVDY